MPSPVVDVTFAKVAWNEASSFDCVVGLATTSTIEEAIVPYGTSHLVSRVQQALLQ